MNTKAQGLLSCHSHHATWWKSFVGMHLVGHMAARLVALASQRGGSQLGFVHIEQLLCEISKKLSQSLQDS